MTESLWAMLGGIFYFGIFWFIWAITLFSKDEKFKILLTDLYHLGYEDSSPKMRNCSNIENEDCGKGPFLSPTKEQWQEIKSKVPVIVNLLIDNIFDVVNSREEDF